MHFDCRIGFTCLSKSGLVGGFEVLGAAVKADQVVKALPVRARWQVYMPKPSRTIVAGSAIRTRRCYHR